jgi:hypothetical protein
LGTVPPLLSFSPLSFCAEQTNWSVTRSTRRQSSLVTVCHAKRRAASWPINYRQKSTSSVGNV